MKYLALFLFSVCFMSAKSSDTLYLEDDKDIRYRLYLDSMKAYEIGYSVAKNLADSVRGMIGNNSLDPYFIGRYMPNGDALSGGYFYEIDEDVKVEIGHVNTAYHGMKNDTKIPWKYLEDQYKRLDAIKVQPSGIMQGGELPNVYVYAKPSLTVIVRNIKRFTVVDESIKFFMKGDGKTRVSYICKYYYSQEGFQHQKLDSVEKLDPIKKQHFFE